MLVIATHHVMMITFCKAAILMCLYTKKVVLGLEWRLQNVVVSSTLYDYFQKFDAIVCLFMSLLLKIIAMRFIGVKMPLKFFSCSLFSCSLWHS